MIDQLPCPYCEACDAYEMCKAKDTLDLVKKHLEDRLEFLAPATDYECETLKMELKNILKIIHSSASSPSSTEEATQDV